MDLKRFSKYGVATMVTAGAGVAAVAIFGGDGEPAVVKAPTALADSAAARPQAPAPAPAPIQAPVPVALAPVAAAPAAKPMPVKKPAKVQKVAMHKAAVHKEVPVRTPLKRTVTVDDKSVEKAKKRVAEADAKVKQAKVELRKSRSEAAKARAELAKLTAGKTPHGKPHVLPRPITHPGGKVHVSLDSSQVKPGQSRTITKTSPDGSASSSVTVSRG